MPRKPHPDGDSSPDEAPVSAKVAWLDETRAAIYQLVGGHGPRQLASAETAVRVLEWLECDREPDWVHAIPDGRTLRMRWSEGDRKVILTIVAGKLDNVRRLRGDTFGPLTKLRTQPLDILRTLVLELGR